MAAQREQLLERRQKDPKDNVWWDRLTLAQKFAASSLIQFGYDLAFVRSSNAGSTAVLICDNRTATVSDDGDIDTSPNIKLR